MVLTAIVQALPIAVGLALAALPIVLIPIALATKRPGRVARAFPGGWFLGVAVVGAIVIIAADVVVLPGDHPRWLSYVKVALGILLVGWAVQKWFSRPRHGEVPKVPKWMAAIDSMTAVQAFGLAFALASVNPKNLVLVVTGATVIADATPLPGEQAVALLVFAIVASVGVATPAALPLILGDRAGPVLASADGWMTRYSAVIVAVVLLVLGVVLLVDGITGAATGAP